VICNSHGVLLRSLDNGGARASFFLRALRHGHGFHPCPPRSLATLNPPSRRREFQMGQVRTITPTSDGTPKKYLGVPRGRGLRAAPPRRGATLTLVATARHNLLQGWHRAAPAQAAPQDQVLPQALPSSHDGG